MRIKRGDLTVEIPLETLLAIALVIAVIVYVAS